jgi:hypothetical protein
LARHRGDEGVRELARLDIVRRVARAILADVLARAGGELAAGGLV